MLKRNVIAVFCLVSFFCPAIASAAYCGMNPVTLKKGKWVVEVEGTRINDRDFKAPAKTSGAYMTGAALDESKQISTRIGYTLIDNLNVYFKFGQASWEVDTNWSDSSKTDLEYAMAFRYGGGIRYTHELPQNFFLGFDFQGLTQSDQEVDSVWENGVKSGRILKPGTAKFAEWQFTLTAAKRFSLAENIEVTPYAGGYYSKFEFKSEQIQYTIGLTTYTINSFKLEEDKSFGFLAGANLKLGKRLGIGFESRFGAEQAISGSISIISRF